MQQNGRLDKVDSFKWLAAFLVVANHTSPLESLNGVADFLLTRVLARVAVPFFFMVTGYFVLHAAVQAEYGMKRIWESLKKTGILYLLVTLLYLPVQLYKLIKEPIEPAAWAGGVLKAVLFDGTYYHLWYLPAMMLGLVICYGLLKLGRKTAFACAGILYLIGLFGDSYYGIAEKIPLLKGMYEGMFHIFSYTRNGIFMAPVFLLAGYEMAIGSRKEEREEKAAARALRNFLICLIFMCAEGLVLYTTSMQRHDSMYLILPVCMLYLFQYLLFSSGRRETGRGSFYINGPMLLYFLHPFVILLVRGFVKVTKLSFILTVSPVYYLAVAVGSLCAVYLYLWGKQYVVRLIRRRRGK